MTVLPKGWSTSKLGELAEFEMGQAPPGNACNTVGDGTVFVKAGEFGPIYPVIREWTTKPLKFSHQGDVLICVVGATAGKLNLGIECAIGRSVAAIRPHLPEMQKSIYGQLRQQVLSLRADSTGSAQGVISKKMLADIKIFVPPLPEQKRIADKLDTVLTRVDAVNTRLARVAPILKRFRQSVLAAATSGRLTEDWRSSHNLPEHQITSLGELIKVSSGDGLTAKEMHSDGGIPVYGGNGVNGYHNEANVSEPTIVIGRVGYYCGSVHLTPSAAWITDNALRVKFSSAILNREFLHYALMGTNLRENMSSTAQPVISGQKIYPLEFRLPILEEQVEIVRCIEILFTFADRLEARLKAAQTATERLTPSLLAKAFRGALVPQDPNDEPASELVRRLQATVRPSEIKLGRKRPV